MSKNTVKIVNVKKNISRDDMDNLFYKYGKIKAIGKEKNTYYVTFNDPRDAVDAIKSTNGNIIKGHKLNAILSDEPTYESNSYYKKERDHSSTINSMDNEIKFEQIYNKTKKERDCSSTVSSMDNESSIGIRIRDKRTCTININKSIFFVK